jgi:hypothetical protein
MSDDKEGKLITLNFGSKADSATNVKLENPTPALDQLIKNLDPGFATLRSTTHEAFKEIRDYIKRMK